MKGAGGVQWRRQRSWAPSRACATERRSEAPSGGAAPSPPPYSRMDAPHQQRMFVRRVDVPMPLFLVPFRVALRTKEAFAFTGGWARE